VLGTPGNAILKICLTVPTDHLSHTTTEGSTSHLLAHLIARDDEVRGINALLVVTSERLETESNCANTFERRTLEYFSQLRQDIINQVSAPKSEAEAEAARAGTKARKLIEEKMVTIAYKEGGHCRYKQGLSYGRRVNFDEGRSWPIRYSTSLVH